MVVGLWEGGGWVEEGVVEDGVVGVVAVLRGSAWEWKEACGWRGRMVEWREGRAAAGVQVWVHSGSSAHLLTNRLMANKTQWLDSECDRER